MDSVPVVSVCKMTVGGPLNSIPERFSLLAISRLEQERLWAKIYEKMMDTKPSRRWVRKVKGTIKTFRIWLARLIAGKHWPEEEW